MEDLLKLAVILGGLGVTGTLLYTAVRFVNVTIRRLEGKHGEEPHPGELADMQARIAELEAQQGRMLELEERLDFAERLLAQRREVERLGPGEG